MKTKLSKSAYALKIAHAMQKTDLKNHPWKDLVRHAWYFVRFRKWLKEGIVVFSFIKLDGSIREARGTLHHMMIPIDDMPTSSENYEPNFVTMAFYDIDKKAWRSFRFDKFVGFVSVYNLLPKDPSRP